jgi:hypothetical protein
MGQLQRRGFGILLLVKPDTTRQNHLGTLKALYSLRHKEKVMLTMVPNQVTEVSGCFPNETGDSL